VYSQKGNIMQNTLNLQKSPAFMATFKDFDFRSKDGTLRRKKPDTTKGETSIPAGSLIVIPAWTINHFQYPMPYLAVCDGPEIKGKQSRIDCHVPAGFPDPSEGINSSRNCPEENLRLYSDTHFYTPKEFPHNGYQAMKDNLMEQQRGMEAASQKEQQNIEEAKTASLIKGLELKKLREELQNQENRIKCLEKDKLYYSINSKMLNNLLDTRIEVVKKAWDVENSQRDLNASEKEIKHIEYCKNKLQEHFAVLDEFNEYCKKGDYSKFENIAASEPK
jgi:hypothetical protein